MKKIKALLQKFADFLAHHEEIRKAATMKKLTNSKWFIDNYRWRLKDWGYTPEEIEEKVKEEYLKYNP